MVYDIERIGAIISDLQKYFKDLESMGIERASDLEDKKNFYSTSMLLFSIINRTVDLGEEIVCAENLGTPTTYKDIFHLLRSGNVIDKDLEKKLSGLVSYRNLLAHEYQGVTEADVFNIHKKVGVAKALVKITKDRIKA